MLRTKLSSAKETLDVLTRDRAVAPWAGSDSALHTVDLVLRCALFLAAPLFFAMCWLLGQTELLVVTAGLLLVVSTVGSAERLLERVPALEKFRFLGPALRLTHEVHEHYRARRPAPLVFYLAYPLYAVIGAIVSPSVRAEIKLHARFLLLLGLLLVVEGAGQYWAKFRPHLTVVDSVPILLERLGLMLALVVGYVMPTTTTVYTLDLSGRRRLLRGIVGVALVLSVPAVWSVHKVFERRTSFAAAKVLDLRMTKPTFRQDLRDLGSMFLSFHSRANRHAHVTEAPSVHADLTKRFRKVIRADLPEEETLSFSVLTFKEPGTANVWFAIRYTTHRHPYLLMVAGPTGAVIRKWADLPAWIPAKFQVSPFLEKRGAGAHWLARRRMDAELDEED